MLIRQSLTEWLGDQIQVQSVDVTPGPGGDFSQIIVQIGYLLIETQSQAQTEVLVS